MITSILNPMLIICCKNRKKWTLLKHYGLLIKALSPKIHKMIIIFLFGHLNNSNSINRNHLYLVKLKFSLKRNHLIKLFLGILKKMNYHLNMTSLNKNNQEKLVTFNQNLIHLKSKFNFQIRKIQDLSKSQNNRSLIKIAVLREMMTYFWLLLLKLIITSRK